MEDLEKYRKMGQELIDKLKLLSFPIAIKILKNGEEMPKGTFFRPHEFFGSWILHVHPISGQGHQGCHFI